MSVSMFEPSEVYRRVCTAVEADLKDINTPAARRMLENVSKKMNPKANEPAQFAAITDFFENNDRIRSFSLKNLDEYDRANMRDFITNMLQIGAIYVSERFDLYLAPQSVLPLEIFSHPEFLSFGYGASAEGDATHIIDKMIRQQLSITPSCEKYVGYLKSFSTSFHKKVTLSEKVKVDIYSKIALVPKNEERARIIAKERSLNLIFQLALGKFMSYALECQGINIQRQQEMNRLLAYKGSLESNQESDNCPCTIDSKMASDCITIELVEAIFPKEIVEHFISLRSSHFLISKRFCDDNLQELPMISTMGNGFTFPLLTMVSLAIVYAANCRFEDENPQSVGIPEKYWNTTQRFKLDWNTIGVFGDDIIVPRKIVSETIKILTNCGFIVNANKTFTEGLFRESCGADVYNGHVITPVYLTSLESPQDLLIAANLLFEWSARHHYLRHTLDYIISLIPDKYLQIVPLGLGYDAGIIFPTSERMKDKIPFIFYEQTSKQYTFHIDPNIEMFGILGGFFSSAGTVTYVDRIEKIRKRKFIPKPCVDSTRECQRIPVVRKAIWSSSWNFVPSNWVPGTRKTVYNSYIRLIGYIDIFDSCSQVVNRQMRHCRLVWSNDRLSKLIEKISY